eukprot:gene3124-40061_t
MADAGPCDSPPPSPAALGAAAACPLGAQFSDPAAVRARGECLGCWRVLLGPGAPFLVDYHRDHGEYVKGDGGEQPSSGTAGWREWECTTVVQAPFTQHTRYVERQRFALLAPPGAGALLVFQVSAQSPEVMLGDCFRVEVAVCFEEGAGGVHGMINMLKGTLMRYKIVSAGTAELRKTLPQTPLLCRTPSFAAALAGMGEAPAPRGEPPEERARGVGGRPGPVTARPPTPATPTPHSATPAADAPPLPSGPPTCTAKHQQNASKTMCTRSPCMCCSGRRVLLVGACGGGGLLVVAHVDAALRAVGAELTGVALLDHGDGGGAVWS